LEVSFHAAPCGERQERRLLPEVPGNFVPTKFRGTGVVNHVFNFTPITIPASVTITLTANLDNAPVYWSATERVEINGTLSLDVGALGRRSIGSGASTLLQARGARVQPERRLDEAVGCNGETNLST